MIVYIAHIAKPQGRSPSRSCNFRIWSGACCLNIVVLAEILMVTKAVELAPDVLAAATQALGLPPLPSLGAVVISAAAIMLLSLPLPIVHGWTAQPALGHPLIIPPYHSSTFLLGL